MASTAFVRSSYCALTGCCQAGDKGRFRKRREIIQYLHKVDHCKWM